MLSTSLSAPQRRHANGRENHANLHASRRHLLAPQTIRQGSLLDNTPRQWASAFPIPRVMYPTSTRRGATAAARHGEFCLATPPQVATTSWKYPLLQLVQRRPRRRSVQQHRVINGIWANSTASADAGMSLPPTAHCVTSQK